ncbi:hypothetical protein J4216_03740 [Candidatus Woesearchaeota archaeon]|nr:hypothetical protein [Candidatus Woesearchaeota archaeon]
MDYEDRDRILGEPANRVIDEGDCLYFENELGSYYKSQKQISKLTNRGRLELLEKVREAKSQLPKSCQVYYKNLDLNS